MQIPRTNKRENRKEERGKRKEHKETTPPASPERERWRAGDEHKYFEK